MFKIKDKSGDLRMILIAFISIVLGLALLPTVFNFRDASQNSYNATGVKITNPNITSSESSLVGIVPLMFVILLVVAGIAGVLVGIRSR